MKTLRVKRELLPIVDCPLDFVQPKGSPCSGLPKYSFKLHPTNRSLQWTQNMMGANYRELCAKPII